MGKHVFIWVLLLGLPALVLGQSLGDTARKERERRERNKADGVSAREFSAEEIFGEEDDDAASDAVEDEEESAETAPRRRPSMPSVDLDSIASEPDERETERLERSRDEAAWRAKFQQARARIDNAREQVRFLAELSLMPGESYVDTQGRSVIRSLEHLRKLVELAETELSDAEATLSALQEEARRAGVPPGWYR